MLIFSVRSREIRDFGSQFPAIIASALVEIGVNAIY